MQIMSAEAVGKVVSLQQPSRGARIIVDDTSTGRGPMNREPSRHPDSWRVEYRRLMGVVQVVRKSEKSRFDT